MTLTWSAPFETKRSQQRGDDVPEQAVQVYVRGALNVQITASKFVQSLAVHPHKGIRAQDGVVRLDNRRGDHRCRDHELAGNPRSAPPSPSHPCKSDYCHDDDYVVGLHWKYPPGITSR